MYFSINYTFPYATPVMTSNADNLSLGLEWQQVLLLVEKWCFVSWLATENQSTAQTTLAASLWYLDVDTWQ